jgi:poly(A) polymerase
MTDSSPQETNGSQPSSEPRTYGPDDHKINRADLDPDAVKVVLRLVRAGYSAYIVGGGVRDLILGKTPKDYDISTDATPRDVKNLFRNCRIIGRRFKLAHVFFANGKILEVSTFRDAVEEWSDPAIEGAEESSSPIQRDNVYGTEQTDAVRRDLTINGLFFDVSASSVIDYVGGMNDLRAGIVRVIGDPDVRFREDPVRMMRVIRHAARNGFTIERSCWKSVLKNRELLTQASQVRVFDELKKDLTSGHLLNILSLLTETRLIEQMLPELLEHDSVHLSARSDFGLALERVDETISNGEELSPTVPLTIIALFTAGSSLSFSDLPGDFGDVGELYTKLSSTFTTLAVPRKERERIALLAASWLKMKHTSPNSMKSGPVKRLQLLPELIALLTLTRVSRDDEQVIRILERAFRERDNDGTHFERRGRRGR